MLFDVANVPYWIFLGMGVLLFAIVVVSGGGDDDFDVDADADVDIDTDADGGFEASQALGWLGIGKAPLILLLATDLSIWGTAGWMLNVAVGEHWGEMPSGAIGLGVLFGALAIAMVLGGMIARPMGQAFASFGEDAGSDRLVGCVGTVSTVRIPLIQENKIGQVDVLDPARNLVTVNAALPEWATVVPQRGEKILVIERMALLYLVIVKDSADQDRWLANSSTKDSR
ncbi:DUF1449 family protein [Oculatella sp. LEGE 06141]|uniref:OB-fold-containig protein n=1 Tax=Oculatella sp. LEGE 06141 TaxID=1828648 RepID=UPI001882DE06|nr:OB-fold-containig protein [Oculatella sp. LEGE 06141]MBE9177131.1 DUF1449 family protein [Oculatella sp. LEGE 06141]